MMRWKIRTPPVDPADPDRPAGARRGGPASQVIHPRPGSHGGVGAGGMDHRAEGNNARRVKHQKLNPSQPAAPSSFIGTLP